MIRFFAEVRLHCGSIFEYPKVRCILQITLIEIFYIRTSLICFNTVGAPMHVKSGREPFQAVSSSLLSLTPWLISWPEIFEHQSGD